MAAWLLKLTIFVYFKIDTSKLRSSQGASRRRFPGMLRAEAGAEPALVGWSALGASDVNLIYAQTKGEPSLQKNLCSWMIDYCNNQNMKKT